MMIHRALMGAAGAQHAVSPWASWDGSLDGSVATFRTTLVVYNSVAALSSSTVLVTWEDAALADTGYICAGTISGTTITWGTPVEFSAGSSSSVTTLVGLSSTLAVVGFVDTGDSNKLKAVALTVSGTTITLGSIVTVESNSINALSIAKLSATKAIIAYNGSTPKGKAMVLDVSGTTITTNTAYAFNSTSLATNVSVQAISSTQALLVYSDVGNSSYGTAQVIDISSSTVSSNSEYVFNSAVSTLFQMAAISSSTFALVYKDAADSNYSAVQILSVAGTVVSYGSKVRLVNLVPQSDYISVAKADSSSAYFFYRNITTSYGAAVVGTISGTAITLGTPVIVKSGIVSAVAAATLDSTHVMVVYRDHGDSSKGKGKISRV